MLPLLPRFTVAVAAASRPRRRRDPSLFVLLLASSATLWLGCADESSGGGPDPSDLLDTASDTGSGSDAAPDAEVDAPDVDAADDTAGDASDTTDEDGGGDTTDTGGGDVEPDTTAMCVYEGEACPGGTQCCDDSQCADDQGSPVCARSCTADVQCADVPGTVCRRETGAPGEPLLCLSAQVVQCEACSEDTDCAGTSNRCVELGGGEQVCLQACGDDGDCAGLAAGTVCAERVVEGQFGPVTVNLCVPPMEVCSCNDPDGDGYGTGPGCANAGEDCAPMDGARFPDATEVCNELDDNCDGVADELWDKTSDTANCGTCGTSCTASGGTPSCDAGQCVVACDGTLADCDSDPTTCETDLASSMQHCGACNAACSAGAGASGAMCSAGLCAVTGCAPGLADCDADAGTGCEVNLATDLAHCGTCGNACSASGGAPTCSGGQCGASCPGSLADCDSDPTTCETDLATSTAHCGACNAACVPTSGVATLSCEVTGCEVASCTGSLADCDGDFANGCEIDTGSDPSNCQGCGNVCYFGPNTVAGCGASGCENQGCAAGFADCNQNPADGCEINVAVSGACVCQPGAQRSCWTGAPADRGRGECSDGQEVCGASGMAYGPCQNQTLPAQEICANGLDEDCSGTADDVSDIDGDGFTRCQSDCCETTADGCSEPVKVNPRAFDAGGNGLDDDCDGIIDNPPSSSCSSAANFSGPTATALAQAMDICQATTLSGAGFGLISATLSTAAPGVTLQPFQYAVMEDFGANVAPQGNQTLASLSSGTARDAGDPDPINPDGTGFVDSANSGPAPADYLAAHGGQLQSAPGCPTGSTTVNDMARLHLQLRAPSNAQGFQYQFKFYSAEYPEWVCDSYNDFFLAMLYSGAPGIPADHNISFDANGNPVSVNNAFFDVCQGCPLGTAQLVGTNYPTDDAGATAWLTTTAPVVPGEVIDLYFYIWDTGDHSWDSTVLLDNFQWRLQPTTVSTND